MMALVLAALAQTAPAPPPLEVAPPVEQPAPPPPPLVSSPPGVRGPRAAVYFAPLSLFGLYLSVEAEVALPAGLSAFGGVGGGVFGQLGADAGLRYALLGTSLVGPYVDLRASGFFLPGETLSMLGPGVALGHTWETRGTLISVGVGVTLWWLVQSTPWSLGLMGNPPDTESVFVFPGLSVPPIDGHAVQPTLRFSVGPAF